jgi:hypothetical protein
MNCKKIFITFGLAILITPAFQSCSKSSTADLQDAQLCLNKATPAEALDCVSKISGDTSPLAYSLRCSAIFISEGFGDASSFINALDNINGNSSGGCGGTCSSTVSALTQFKFTSSGLDASGRSANNEKAALAFSQCSQADAKIYTQIASLFQLGTLASMLAQATSGTMDETSLKNALLSGGLSDETIGTIISVTYSTACTNLENASTSTAAYCNEIGNAIKAGYTTTDIGDCIQKKLANSAYVCPTP